MTQYHWPLAIVRICQWKELAAETAPDVFSPWSLPKLAAKPEAINAAETAVGDPKRDADVILLVRPDNPLLPGGVIWINAEDVSDSHQFASFEDFFSALVDYNEGTAQYAAIRAKEGGRV